MAEFQNINRQRFDLSLTVGTVRRVEKLTKVNLGALDESTWAALASDWGKLADVLCAICRPQLAELAMSDEDFADGLAGQCLQDAVDALMESLVSFFPPPKAALLREAVKMMGEAEAVMIQAARERLNALAVDFGKRLISAPESSGLTPTPGPCVT